MKSIVGTENAAGMQDSLGYAQSDIAAYYSSSGSQHNQEFDVMVLWHILRRRWWLMLLAAVVVLVVGGYIIYKEQSLYESQAWIQVSTGQSRMRGSGSEETMSVDELVALAKARTVVGQMSVIRSPDVQYEVIDKIGLEKFARAFGPEKAYPGALFPEDRLEVESPQSSGFISITVTSYDPQASADIANTFASVYLERARGSTADATKQGRLYVQQEKDEVYKELLVAQKKLSEFKSANKLASADSKLGEAAGSVSSFELEYDRARIEQAASSKRMALLKQQLDKEGVEVEQGKTIVENPFYKEAEGRLNRLNIQRIVALQDFKPESPEVQRIDTEINAIQEQMSGFAKQITPNKSLSRNPYLDQYISATIENTAASSKMKALSGVMASRTQKLVAMPEVERKYEELKQDVDFLNRAYQTLADKYYALLVNEKSTLPEALFAANAWPPTIPTNSKRKKIPQLVVIALMLSVASVLVAEKLDKKLRDETRMMKLTGEEPMAVIPKVKGLKNPFAKLVDSEDRTNFLEAFRILRNSIYYSNPNGAPKLLAISSPGRGEGKSTTSLCLSIAIAMDNKKVLVVDCDFRRPSLYRWIKAPNDLGLSYVLAGEASVEEAIIPTSHPNLFCLPAGPLPSNPSEELNSRVSREIMNKLASEYDIVVLDCPPCAGLSDMQVISRMVDGVLLVASIDQTHKKRLDEGFRMLRKVYAPIIGYVVNRFNMNPRGYDYYSAEEYDLPKWNRDEPDEPSTSLAEAD